MRNDADTAITMRDRTSSRSAAVCCAAWRDACVLHVYDVFNAYPRRRPCGLPCSSVSSSPPSPVLHFVVGRRQNAPCRSAQGCGLLRGLVQRSVASCCRAGTCTSTCRVAVCGAAWCDAQCSCASSIYRAHFSLSPRAPTSSNGFEAC